MMIKPKLIEMFIFSSIGFVQINYSKLLSGTSEIKSDFGTITVERSKNFQLESIKNF